MSDVPPRDPSDGEEPAKQDAPATDGAPSGEEDNPVKERIFPRLFYMIGFAIVLHFALWIVFALAILQLVVILVTREENPDIASFGRNFTQYMWEIMAYIVWVKDDLPFPFGRFPRVPETGGGAS